MPMEPDVKNTLNSIDAKLDAIQRATAVLADIVDPGIGLERIWPNRRAWTEDPKDGMKAWKKRVCEARQIDFASNTLWSNWIGDTSFCEDFFKSLAGKTAARILIYDPASEILQLRARDEREQKLAPGITEMQLEINLTLQRIAQGRKDENLGATLSKNLQVRLSTWSYQPAQLIRADERILVAIYLSGKTGSHCPTFQLRGPETSFFRTYLEQINILWQRGREVSDGEFAKLVSQPQPQPQPPPKLRKLLVDHFGDSDLRDICFDLRVPYDDLAGVSKSDKARELIIYLEHRGRVSELVEVCSRLRPNAPWLDSSP